MNNSLENIRIFSEDVIPVYDTDTGEKVVLGRELHEKLKIKTPYHIWFPRMVEYGFVDGTDILRRTKMFTVKMGVKCHRFKSTTSSSWTWQSTLQ